MSKISKRVSRYLLSRQSRAARLEAFGRAAEAGVLEEHQLGVTSRDGTVWRLSADQAAQFSGDVDHDRDLTRNLLKVSSCNRKRLEMKLESGEFNDFDDEEFGEVGEVDKPVCSVRVDQNGTTPSSSKLLRLRDHVLSIVGGFAPTLNVREVATALLLARAFEKDKKILDRLLAVMKSECPIIAVQIPVHGFEKQLGRMLEKGLILPFYTSLEPISDGPGLTGHYKSLADSKRRRSLACCGSALLERLDRHDDMRRLVSNKVLAASKPLIISDEREQPLAARLAAVADIVIQGNGIDASLIADVLAICCQIPVGRSWFLMSELEFEPLHLGIDDLAIAIRPGRSLTKIIGILTTLEAENAARAEAKDDDEKDCELGSLLNRSGRSDARKREKYSGCFDMIEPVKTTTGSETARGQKAKQPVKPPSGKDCLFVERLAGYGDARHWALDLKIDLEAFGSKEVEWSDLSSRLLLSGPPGTGKTTFAKALCNTLGVPLIATSVARWLEASNLGDVLAAINATFEQANSYAPCILFIDEIDNIGNRGGSDRPYDDYWSSLVNRVLELLDGAAKTVGVIVVGATNRPEKIDPALLRSGRLEKHIVIPTPDTTALAKIIAHHLGDDLDAVLNSSETGSSAGSKSASGTLRVHCIDSTAHDGSDKHCDSKEGVLING
ncbi:ATP-binding protein [Hoeflea sp. G2-23]|uniref:ATP-binding protein n=1 Tax=Hoeflea algicola TaxID=2983763 RepID=A0ABT3ZAT6_9HYPH|nr:ATP-binding protein [Hoeflea algicola]MCY0148838.1 ATP-binding protein [Hoeflea algicola]